MNKTNASCGQANRRMGSFDIHTLKVRVVLNWSSGSCDKECAANLRNILDQAQVRSEEIELVDSTGIEAALEKAIRPQTDVVIVLGGDGTIRAAAERCGRTGTKLIQLPGGTMNMLPRALYGEGAWDTILAQTLEAPGLMDVGGGEVDGRRFFCAGIFGSPALWADAREAARSNRWLTALTAVSRAYHRAFSRKVYYGVDAKNAVPTTAISVICPLISNAVRSNAPAFEVAALDPNNLKDAAHLAWTATFSDWRKDETVTALMADSVTIKARGAVPAILDGERISLPRATTVNFIRKAFVAVVPDSRSA